MKITTVIIIVLMLASCNSNKKSDTNTKGSVPKTEKSSAQPQAASETISIEQKKWKLKIQEGKNIEMVENQEKAIFFRLDPAENRVIGFSGCNTFNGIYTLEVGNRIRFSNLISTMKVCPDVDVNESEFLRVFELVDNYTIYNGELSLNVGRRAPLAVFEAVEIE